MFVKRLELDVKEVFSAKKKHTITSLPWYNILNNPAYVRDFNYIPVANHSRDILIDEKINPEQDGKFAQSDFIALVINFPYMPNEVANECSLKSQFTQILNFKTLCSSVVGITRAKQFSEDKESMDGS